MADGGDSGENPPPTVGAVAAEKAWEAASDAYRSVKEQPWVEDALRQASSLKQSVEESAGSALAAARARLSEIGSTSQAHFSMTQGYIDDMKEQFRVYEDAFFGKLKDGINVAAAHPAISCGVATGIGLIALKRPRHFMFYRLQRLFVSEEKLLSNADAKVKELRETVDRLTSEYNKLQEHASKAEEEMIRGKGKLRDAGKQIRSLIRSTNKIERKAGGLKDSLSELPRGEASYFRTQVSALASVLKTERKGLSKIVSKISDYGISI